MTLPSRPDDLPTTSAELGQLLADFEIHVAIKSYKRAGRVTTLSLTPYASLWIPASQEPAYREAHPNASIITIPDHLDGNLCRKQNAILDRAPLPNVLILDDDLTRIGYLEAGEYWRADPPTIAFFILRGFQLCRELGATLWGVNQSYDTLNYYTMRPFCLTAPVLGPFHGHCLPCPLRYDESVLGKDDYDFWLQTMQRYHKTLRFNKWHYYHDGGSKPGGFVSQRTLAIEQRGVERMKQKWGELFRMGGHSGARASGDNILNSRAVTPIRGC